MNEDSKAIFKPAVSLTFKEFLKEELMARCERNENYSLRSFAKNLDIDSSSLSQLMSGKRAMSGQMIERLGEKLKIEPEDIELFKKAEEETKHGEFYGADTREPDVYEYFADYNYFAATNLVRLYCNTCDDQTVKACLDLSDEKVNEIRERMVRLNLIEVDENGKWIDLAPPKMSIQASTKDGGPHPGPSMNKSMMARAVQHLDTAEPFWKDAHFHSHVFTMSKKDVERLRIVIRNFARSIVRDSQKKRQEHDSVYGLLVHLFPLTK